MCGNQFERCTLYWFNLSGLNSLNGQKMLARYSKVKTYHCMRYQRHFQFCGRLSFQLEAASEIVGLLWPHRTSSPGWGVWLLCGQEELGVHLHHWRGRVSFWGLFFFINSVNPLMWSNNFLFHFTKPANSGFIELIKDIYQLHDIILY